MSSYNSADLCRVCTLARARQQPMLIPLSAGTLFRASQFLSEELPIRLAHRVQELETLPDGLSEMPSVKKVHDWYAQSFEVCSMSSPLQPKALGHCPSSR